jgi:HSP20 family protein
MTNTIAKRNGTGYAAYGNVLDNIFADNFRRFFDGNFWDAETDLAKGTVPVNIRETEQQYEVDVIAPGCRREDFKISIDKHVLTVSMQHKEETEHKQKNGWVRNEFVQRAFSRNFTLDDTVDTNNITATYADGILRLTLGKNDKAKTATRQIEVK